MRSKMTSIRSWRLPMLLAIAAVLAAGVLAACGDDDSESSGKDDAKTAEKAFLTGMVAHHTSAIEMAKMAQERGQSKFVKDLADDIVSAQESEIGQMESIYARLIGGKLEPDPGAHDGLGLSAEEAGMAQSAEMMDMLREANPFDRAFVDEMVPHHTGAVKMAKAVLKETEDAETRKLAEGIVSAQEREIKEMNAFRTKEYGGPVPEKKAGGDDAMEGMDH